MGKHKKRTNTYGGVQRDLKEDEFRAARQQVTSAVQSLGGIVRAVRGADQQVMPGAVLVEVASKQEQTLDRTLKSLNGGGAGVVEEYEDWEAAQRARRLTAVAAIGLKVQGNPAKTAGRLVTLGIAE